MEVRLELAQARQRQAELASAEQKHRANDAVYSFEEVRPGNSVGNPECLSIYCNFLPAHTWHRWHP